MRGLKIGLSAIAMVAAVFIMASDPSQAQTPGQSRSNGAAQSSVVLSQPDYMEWPLPEADRVYGAINGKHLWQYVVDLAAISERYRDDGHPQFWGRIIGTSGDAENAQWLLNKFKQIPGMTETHIQLIDLPPQWIAQSFKVTLTVGGKTVPLASAQPCYATHPTLPQGLDLETVYVGLGREADFARHDVRGKAVFVFMSGERVFFHGEPAAALERAAAHGAAAIFAVDRLPGDMKVQTYPVDTNVPTFSLALKDGQMVRDLTAQATAGNAPHVKIRLDVKMVTNLKTRLVWGTLPGQTDETIYVIAHRDGWFDAAGDNAGGVASMLGLAEYFAKVPKSQRRRTMVFIGVDGHHNGCTSSTPSQWCQPGAIGNAWLVAHRDELFSKTALMINDEHPSDVETYVGPGGGHSSASPLGLTDVNFPMEWYAGGPSRPDLGKIAADAFREFGVATWAQPSPQPPAGDLGSYYRFVPGVSVSADRPYFFHLDSNTPPTVPWTALEAVTRAYAKIIDEVDKIPLKDLQRPTTADPNAP